MTIATRPSMKATGTEVAPGHWTARAKQLRSDDGGYTFESLAVEMAATLGWYPAAGTALKVGELADYALYATTALDSIVFEQGYLGGKPEPEHVDLHLELGWSQSVLLAGWFRSLENMRTWRDWDRTI